MTLRSLWQVVASWALLFVVGILASLAMVLTLGVFWYRMTPWILRHWGRAMLWIAGVELEVEGAGHLAADQAMVGTFNHGSVLDAFLITAIMPRGSVAAIKREVLYYPVVGFTLYLFGFLLLDRGNGARAKATMKRAGDRMRRERMKVFISPEGTRSFTAELLPFKKGPFHLAMDSGAPIVPVVIDGAVELHPPGRWTTTPGLVRIRILPPRSSAGFSPASLGAEADALRELYVAEVARMKAERAAREAAPALAAGA
jgi:1-acyl-sn-glycerol-3-phosphate acyltransferase